MTDEYNLKAAISHYDTEYSRLPDATNQDATFGFTGTVPGVGTRLAAPLGDAIQPTNNNIMSILLNENVLANLGHARNPQQNIFYDGKRTAATDKAGISTTDWQVRDPWGNPYIITLDLNYDGKCFDAFYRYMAISQPTSGGPIGLNGLVNESKPDGKTDDYVYKGDVMIWSMGPDGAVDPGAKANQGKNKDNVIGW